MNPRRRRLIAILVMVSMGVACTVGFAYFIFPTMLASYQAQVADRPSMSGEEFVAASETLDEKYLAIEGLEIVGKPLEIKHSAMDFSDFVLVQSTGSPDNNKTEVTEPVEGSDKAIVILNSREKTDLPIADMIRQGQLKGGFYALEDDLSPETTSSLQQHFPGLDLELTRFVKYHRPLSIWMFWVVCGMFAMQPFTMAWLAYSLFLKPNKSLKEKNWAEKISDDRAQLYRSSQKAMRLINHTTYSNGTLQQRTVDASYDVPATKKTTRRTTKHIAYVLAGILANCLVAIGISYLQSSSDFFAGFGDLGGQLLMLIPLIIGGI